MVISAYNGDWLWRGDAVIPRVEQRDGAKMKCGYGIEEGFEEWRNIKHLIEGDLRHYEHTKSAGVWRHRMDCSIPADWNSAFCPGVIKVRRS